MGAGPKDLYVRVGTARQRDPNEAAALNGKEQHYAADDKPNQRAHTAPLTVCVGI